MPKKPTRKINKPTHKQLKKYCDDLWSLCVKARAGFKSELSGKTEMLNAHHLRGKSNYALRYSLINGFCCTGGEHIFGFHHTGRREQYEERVKLIRGKDIFERIQADAKEDLNLHDVRNALEGELIDREVDFEHIKKKNKILCND